VEKLTNQIPKQLKNQIKEIRSDSVKFIESVLGVSTLEEYQRNIIRSVDENERTAIAACHDVGKSFLMARISMAYLSLYPNSKVITTAPTYNQVQRILWSEIRSAYQTSSFPLGGQINQTDWTFSPDWFAIGFTPRNEIVGTGLGQGTQSSFQGFHAKRLMVVFDEATGIPPSIWNMAEGLLTSANVKFVAIGNPTSKNSEFYNCFKSPAWKKINLSCFDSPNLIINNITSKEKINNEVQKIKSMSDEDARKYLTSYKVVRPYLLTTKWVIESIFKWGIEHPLTESKIFGEFPEINDNSLVSLGIVEESQRRIYYPTKSDRKSIGVDVARFGVNSTVITVLHGLRELYRKEMFKLDALQIVGEVINLSRIIGNADIIVVDETGVGGGVVDLLKDAIGSGLPESCEVRGVQFGAACEDDSDKEKFVNMKARMYGLLRDDLKKEDGLSLLDEAIYLEELTSIIYRYNQKGQMVIESKDDYKKRTGRKSPDSSDSLALANFGRYDELKVGSFTKDTDPEENPSTLSGGINSSRKW
jgi:phage terminase large subunit